MWNTIWACSLPPQSASPLAAGLWPIEGLLLLARARREEQLLLAHDEHYRTYVARVRYRFVPFIV
ncbi:MAG: hypothetical protein ACREC6_14905 [Hyphomicrobiaceae bacterium]